MNKKILLTLSVISLFIFSLCSYSFAANNNMMNNAKNTAKNIGNSIGNATVSTKNAVVDGAKDIANGASTLGNDVMGAADDLKNDTRNTMAGVLDNGDNNYTATRTATDNSFLGMSTGTWTWLILGIVGVLIVALVWYYGSQYEHKNYNDDN